MCLSIAFHLQRIGQRVILLKSSSIGREASFLYSNVGTIMSHANITINNPSILCKLPTLIFDNNDSLPIMSLFHNVRVLLTMILWVVLFAWNCRTLAVEHTSQLLGVFLLHSETWWEPAFWPMQPWRVRNRYLILQCTFQDVELLWYSTNLCQRHVCSLKMVALNTNKVLELKTTLAARGISLIRGQLPIPVRC